MDVNRKIKIDGDYLQSYQDDMIDVKLDKMNQRVTFFFIITTCVIGLALAFVYFYINEYVTKVPKEIQELSLQVVERMSGLSQRYSDLEQALSGKLSMSEKLVDAMRKDQKDIQNSISNLSSAMLRQDDVTKIVRNEISSGIALTLSDTNKALKVLQSNVQIQYNALTEQINTINKLMAEWQQTIQEMNNKVESVQTEVNKYEANYKELTDYLNHAIDQNKLEQQLKIERNEMSNTFSRQKAILEKKIEVLEEKIFNLEELIKKNQSQVKKKKPSQNKEVTSQTKPDDKRPDVKRPASDLIPKPDKSNITQSPPPKDNTPHSEASVQPTQPIPPPEPGSLYEEELSF